LGYHRKRWEFDLHELAWEHLGLARGYDCASLKRKLRPAFAELERLGYLRPLPDGQRFQKVRSGQWRVVVERTTRQRTAKTGASAPMVAGTLTDALIARGVAATTARATVERYPVDRIQTQLGVFDWLSERADPRIARNPPGFLLTAIKGEFAPPADYQAAQVKVERERKRAERRAQAAERREQQRAKAAAQEAEAQATARQRWEALSAAERLRLSEEAVAQAPAFLRRLIEQGGSSGEAARQAVLTAYAIGASRFGSANEGNPV
jgi:hypothetical protein